MTKTTQQLAVTSEPDHNSISLSEVTEGGRVTFVVEECWRKPVPGDFPKKEWICFGVFDDRASAIACAIELADGAELLTSPGEYMLRAVGDEEQE